MDRKRIAIYLNECPTLNTRPFVQIIMNHSYNNKIASIVERSALKRTELARTCLFKAFGTNSIKELKAMIEYSSEQQSKPINVICKMAIKKALDNY